MKVCCQVLRALDLDITKAPMARKSNASSSSAEKQAAVSKQKARVGSTTPAGTKKVKSAPGKRGSVSEVDERAEGLQKKSLASAKGLQENGKKAAKTVQEKNQGTAPAGELPALLARNSSAQLEA